MSIAREDVQARIEELRDASEDKIFGWAITPAAYAAKGLPGPTMRCRGDLRCVIRAAALAMLLYTHTGELDGAKLDAIRAGFINALDVLTSTAPSTISLLREIRAVAAEAFADVFRSSDESTQQNQMKWLMDDVMDGSIDYDDEQLLSRWVARHLELIVPTTVNEIDAAVARLATSSVLGLDTENVAYVNGGGAPRNVSVVQLASPELAVVISVHRLGIPPSLKGLLQNGKVKKAVLNLGHDRSGLAKLNITLVGGVEVKDMIKSFWVPPRCARGERHSQRKRLAPIFIENGTLTDTCSYDDPRAQRALSDYAKARKRNGLADIELLTIDNPGRDEPALKRQLYHVISGTDKTKPKFEYAGELIVPTRAPRPRPRRRVQYIL